MNYKEVVLTSIGKVKVYRPPTMKINRMVSAKYTYPDQPVKRLKLATPKGQPSKYEEIKQADGPLFDAWKGECDAIRAEWNVEINDYTYMFMLKDVVVPDEFDAEAEYGTFARMLDENWKARAGETGRRLDYLEWFVMGLGDDTTTVNAAYDELLGLSQEVVDDVKDTFPGDVEGETA